MLAVLDEAALHRLLPMADAIAALERALRDGLDPEAQPARHAVDLPAGQLLLMPAGDAAYAGVKVVGVAPGNPARGLARVQAAYLLHDGATLAPLAVLDGAALTLLRTPAVTALAARYLAPDRVEHLVVFGTGPQAAAHIPALRCVREVGRVSVVGRDPDRTARLVERCQAGGVPARAGTPGDVATADAVVCATSATEPLFDGRLVPDHACVLAIGAHRPSDTEVDAALVRRATVVVEARAAALREAGTVLRPLRAGLIGPDHIAGTLADLVSGALTPPAGRPRLFASVGMAWEDLVTATAAWERWRRQPSPGARPGTA